MAGASLILAYIGLDALFTTAEEMKSPERDLPYGIIGSLGVCTVLYIAVAGIMTGIAPCRIPNTPDPVATALDYVGQNFLASYIVSVGTVIALLSTLLVFLYGQTRIMFGMARDGFLPGPFLRSHSGWGWGSPFILPMVSDTQAQVWKRERGEEVAATLAKSQRLITKGGGC
jgi:APA family basic amino acid/polyamine antiporter